MHQGIVLDILGALLYQRLMYGARLARELLETLSTVPALPPAFE
jgi:hypothetical protein